MTPNEARAYLGRLMGRDAIPRRTFTRWVRVHAIPHRRLGRTAVFIGAELDRWFNAQRRGFFA